MGEDGYDGRDFVETVGDYGAGKVTACGQRYNHSRGKVSGDHYIGRLDCRLWCDACGDIKLANRTREGRRHKSMKMGLYSHLAGRVREWTPGDMRAIAGQYLAWTFVLEIREEDRRRFADRKGLDNLFALAKGIFIGDAPSRVKSGRGEAGEFPGARVSAVVHVMGDWNKRVREASLEEGDEVVHRYRVARCCVLLGWKSCTVTILTSM